MRLIGQTAQIDTLLLKIVQLEEENGKLTDTVDWMHDMIWDLIKKSRGLEP